MSLDTGMASFGFVIGNFVMMTTNTIVKQPPFRRPWLHIACGLGAGYMFGSIPRLEKLALQEQERLYSTWDRRKIKNNLIYQKFQARLEEADTLMAQDPVLLAHKEDHGDHHNKFYKKY